MERVAVCPAQDALELPLVPRRRRRAVEPQFVAALLALLFFGLIGTARATGHWKTSISQEIYTRFVPDAASYDH